LRITHDLLGKDFPCDNWHPLKNLPAKGNHFITYGKVLKIAARTFVAARFALSYLMLTTGSKPSSRERFLNTANPDLKMAGSSSRTKPIRLGYRWIFSFPD
jgi:hypothetical protein